MHQLAHRRVRSVRLRVRRVPPKVVALHTAADAIVERRHSWAVDCGGRGGTRQVGVCPVLDRLPGGDRDRRRDERRPILKRRRGRVDRVPRRRPPGEHRVGATVDVDERVPYALLLLRVPLLVPEHVAHHVHQHDQPDAVAHHPEAEVDHAHLLGGLIREDLVEV